jgi:hypothetical protein
MSTTTTVSARRWIGVILAALPLSAAGVGPRTASSAEPPPSLPLPPLPSAGAVPGTGATTPMPIPRPIAAPDLAATAEPVPEVGMVLGDLIEPGPLRRPIDRPPAEAPMAPFLQAIGVPFVTRVDPPLGFTGRSSVVPREGQSDPHFVPVEDRWRVGFPEWDRYGKGHPVTDDYPYMPGRVLDPFNQNVLKGDFPIVGQHLFLDVTPSVFAFQEFRQIPTATTPFESTARPFQENFFGRPNQLLSLNFFSLMVDLNHGDAAFKPTDWRILLNPILSFNNLSVEENGIVSPNVLQGTSRSREFWALQQAFFETKLTDVSTEYDFASIRLGTQPYNHDFRGFLFVDQNRGVRIFGNRNGNRDEYNIVYFRQWEKDTNSFLNTFNDRRQNLVFANYYRQDFIFPGYTAQLSLAVDNDPKSFKFDKNRFLVRPDPVGLAKPHEVDVVYLGWAGDGHFGRFNVTHQFYEALGYDTLNPLANRAQTINAQMFAIEGSYDRDWVRFRVSFFWSSGDHNINNTHATGFDTILDAPNFAGGPFSFWNRQAIPLFGVNLVQRLSLVPDLRSSKIQGQANFVNPGLMLPTVGMDIDITPKLKMFNNANVLFFDTTNVLEQFLFDGHIDRFIGTDLSWGFEYKPLLSENAVFILGTSVLIPGQGFRDLYNNYSSRVDALFGGFLFASISF